MSLQISIFSAKACKVVMLPATDDSDYTIHLNKDLFPEPDIREIYMEVVDGKWKFHATEEYQIENNKEKIIYDGSVISNGQIYNIRYYNGAILSLFINETFQPFGVFSKYSLLYSNSITIGRNETNDISMTGTDLIQRERHAVIRRDREVWILDSYSPNGTFVNSAKVNGSKQLEFGDHINVLGIEIVFLGDTIAVNDYLDSIKVNTPNLVERVNESVEVEREGILSGKIKFHRSPRQIFKIDDDVVEIDAPPAPSQENKKPLIMSIGPSLTMALPMSMGCIMSIAASRMSGRGSSAFMYTGLITAFGSAIIGAIWAIVNLNYEKKRRKEEELHRFQAYGEYLIKCSNEIKEKYDRNIDHMRRMHQDAAVCVASTEDTTWMWNRNTGHADYLTYRLGTGDLPFQVKINVPKEKFTMVNDSMADRPQMIKDSFRTLRDVPVCVDLYEHKMVGVIGGKGRVGAFNIVYDMVAQIATSNSYTDVKLVFLYDEIDEQDGVFRFAKWLPHVWSADRKIRYIASNKSDIGDVVYALATEFRIRMENASGFSREKEIPKPYYILFVSNPSLIEGEMIASYVYNNNPVYGLSSVLLVESYEQLPNACDYVIENDEYFQGMYHVADNLEERVAINFDYVTENQMEWFAKNLSNLEVNETEIGGEIPNSLSFFDMYGISRLEELKVVERWKKNRTYDSMKALIGQKQGGKDCFLDVHEKYHGPHGLVAGTTGSGKSETLQTYLLSLAINFSPDDVGLFLIDYKGGGMANLFDGLPHVMGQISNLSGNQVRRAMVSIKSENKRRQRIFNEHGVNNINLYTKLYKNNEASIPVPHMFIVIDEFAELKREEPEFMKELISVAQVGRSLGVHLILATQKPSGTVDDNIWSNSKFRLCLRVQDRTDSNDMLHRPDAAYITQAGRCYLQVGNDELFELFQSGYSGETYDETGESKTDIATMISETGKAELVGNHLKKKKRAVSGKNEKTQLDAVVEYLGEVAKQNGYKEPMKLWMPLLPTELYLSELAEYSEKFDGTKWNDASSQWNLNVQIGRFDDPVHQAQGDLTIDFAENGHHAIIGMAGCGKSTFIQTLCYGLVNKYTPEELNIYFVDFSSKMAESFKNMPHVGGVCYEGDEDKIAKFFTLMQSIIEERKKLFTGVDYAKFIRARGKILPAILVVFDNIGSFRNKNSDVYDNLILQMIKEGGSLGIFLCITAGGFGSLELPSRMAENIRTCISLEMNDKFAYAEVVRQTRLEVLPEVNVKGRGLARVGEQILEFHTALAFRAEDDFKRMEAIEELANTMSEVWTGKEARRIPEIPEKPVWDEYKEVEDVKHMQEEGIRLPIGYNSKNASIYGIKLSEIYTYLVMGKAKTGKTNFMKLAMMTASGIDNALITVFDFDNELKNIATRHNFEYIDDYKKVYDFFSKLLPDFKIRNAKKKSLVEAEKEDIEIYEEMRAFSPRFIFIGRLSSFVEKISHPEGDVPAVQAFVDNILDKGALHNVFWFACHSQEDASACLGKKSYEFFIRDRKGILLGGNPNAQRLLSFDGLHYSEQSKTQPLGVGMLPENAECSKVIVPVCKG